MSVKRGRRERFSPIDEISRNTEVERGASEERMTLYQRENSIQEDTH
jgi:hypothetical protein